MSNIPDHEIADSAQWWKEKHDELEAENEKLREGIDMAHLHLLASICECGEPLKETDAFDCLDALKEVDDEHR